MARRFDISDKLIHFTGSGGECMDDAFARLRAIIREGRLIAGNRMIRGGYRCVCFTEAPIAVIYQPDSDFHLLPEDLRWRHVRFEPIGEQVVDWTWEREWRILCDELAFAPAEAAIVVPNEQWANELRRVHDDDQDMTVELYAQAIDQESAEMWREKFPWRIDFRSSTIDLTDIAGGEFERGRSH